MLRQFQQFNNQIKIKIKINSLLVLSSSSSSTCHSQPRPGPSFGRVSFLMTSSGTIYDVTTSANLLGTFTKACDCALHTNRSKQQAVALKYWLELITKLSYHTDGQEQILAIKDILDYLCDLYQHSDGKFSLKSLQNQGVFVNCLLSKIISPKMRLKSPELYFPVLAQTVPQQKRTRLRLENRGRVIVELQTLLEQITDLTFIQPLSCTS